jgi:hypothetical protein
MDDWFQAEAEIFGRKSIASMDKKEKESEYERANAAA